MTDLPDPDVTGLWLAQVVLRCLGYCAPVICILAVVGLVAGAAGQRLALYSVARFKRRMARRGLQP